MKKRFLLKGLLVSFMLLCAAHTWAYDFEVDNIQYTITSFDDMTVEVSGLTNKNVTEVNIPETVEYRERPLTVKTIVSKAFQSNTRLQSASISNTVISIGTYAFDGCTALKEVSIGNGVTSIGKYAFQGCSSLLSVVIPDFVTSIEDYTFYGCSSLTQITFPNSVTSIGGCAFKGCSSLKEIAIPNSVTSIGIGAFRSCSSLKEVTIPNSVTSIGNYAFYECSSIAFVNIPSSVTTMEWGVFYYCSALKTVTMEDGDESLYMYNVHSSPFVGCPIETLYLGRTISCYSDSHSPFRDNTYLTSLTIGEKVTTLGEYEFYGCSSLSEVKIPYSVAEIRESAFADCSGLKTLNLEGCDEMLTMPTSASSTPFSGCPIETLHLGRDVSYDDSYSPFRDNTSLTSLNIGEKVTTLGEYEFYYCTNLKTLNLEDGDETLTMPISASYTPFSGCPIETLHLGRDVSYDDSYSPFRDNTYLTSLTIGEKVATLGEYEFYGCTGLIELNILDNVTRISEYAFACCSGLTYLVIPSNMSEMGEYVFGDCTSLKTLTIEDGEETLTMATSTSSTPFSGCPIETLHLGRDVSYDDSYSPFRDNTSLTSLTIGEKVTTLGEYEFYGCSSLMGVTSLNLVPPMLCSNTFENVTNVEVPKSALNTYALADKWVDIPIIYANDGGDVYYPVPIFYEGNMAIVASGGDENGTVATKGGSIEITPIEKNNLICGLALHDTKDITEELINENSYSFVVSEYHKDNTLYTYSAGDEHSFDVTLSQSGQLLEEITVSKVNDVYYLKVTGDINGTDILTIRRMSNLRILDIEGANIVKGGECYYSSYETSNNEVGVYFFTDMSSLKQVKLPASAVTIGGYAFNNCSDLMTMAIPSKITSIGSSAFYGCSKLVDITIPNNVTRIYNSAYADCAKLRFVTIEDSDNSLSITTSKNSIDGSVSTPFTGCPIETLYLGRNISYSNDISPFEEISTLKTLTIGNKATTISSCAFENCVGLTELIIGSKVASISNNAFDGCLSLAEIDSKNPTPPTITSNTFSGVDKETCVLNVPSGSLNAYWIHVYWGEFFNINEVDFPDGIDNVIVNNDDVQIKGIDGAIVVSGDNVPVYVYTINGMLIGHDIIQGEKSISLPQGNIYIVKAGTQTMKVKM